MVKIEFLGNDIPSWSIEFLVIRAFLWREVASHTNFGTARFHFPVFFHQAVRSGFMVKGRPQGKNFELRAWFHRDIRIQPGSPPQRVSGGSRWWPGKCLSSSSRRCPALRNPKHSQNGRRGGKRQEKLAKALVDGTTLVTFDFCLSTSTHFWTTSTDEVAWPQGDQLLGGGLQRKAVFPATQWLSLPFDIPVGAWPLSPLTPAASSRWLFATGPWPGRKIRDTFTVFASIAASTAATPATTASAAAATAPAAHDTHVMQLLTASSHGPRRTARCNYL